MAWLRMVEGQLLRGCSAGLSEPTAIADLEYRWTGPVDEGAEARIRAGIETLFPDRAESDWPAVFLVDPPTPDPSAGRWLGQWVVALTVAMQQSGNHPVWRGRVVDVGAEHLRLAIPWYDERQLPPLLEAAVGVVAQCCRPEPGTADPAAPFRDNLPAIRAAGLSQDMFGFIRAAVGRDIPFHVLPNCVQFGWGAQAERMEGSYTGRTPLIGNNVAADAVTAGQTLHGAAIPVPARRLATDMNGAVQAAAALGWPVVVKPMKASDGTAIADVRDDRALRTAVEAVARRSPDGVVIEKHLRGDDHRVLVVNGRTVAVARRDPPADVTADVHPENRRLAERAARVVGLDIAGVDFLTTDITRPWRDAGGVVRAVTAQPDIGPHLAADPDRDVYAAVLDITLAGRPVRIPSAAITGTNGKSTTALMLQRIWMASGRRTGVCTTTGVRVDREVVSTENLSGYPGAMMMLIDPGVESVVIELPRRGLIIFGNPCDRYDVAALLNIQDDHLGADGVETLEQMAEVKAEALQRATNAVVVNADDPLCMAMLDRAGPDRHILVTRDPARVEDHRGRGGDAVLIAEGRILLCEGRAETALMALADIPATMDGLLRFNESNAAFAAGLAWAQGLDLEAIRAGLASFENTVEQNPGRYNFIDGLPYRLMVDFAHNPDGIIEVCRVAAALPVNGRRLLCSLNIGSRHGHHVAAVAPALAATFDEFVVGCDREEVDVCPDYATGDNPVTVMLDRFDAQLRANGVAPEAITTMDTDQESVLSATVERARPGDLVVVVAEPPDALPFVAGLLGRQQ